MVGQQMIVTEGMDEGREVLVLSEDTTTGVLYCESVDGETLESGGNVLTEFGFDSERLEPADPNRKFNGMHVVVLGVTESGKKNINKIALEGMKAVIIKLNDKRSQIQLEDGQETLLGNNLMIRDESYVPPKPLDLKRNNIAVFTDDENNKFTGIASSVSGKRCTIKFVRKDGEIEFTTVDRYNVIRVLGTKDILKNIVTDKKTQEKNELEKKLKTLKEVKRDLFSKFDVDTAYELCFSIDNQMDDIRVEIEGLKPERRFINSHITLDGKEKISAKFIKFLQERRKKAKEDNEVSFMGAMVERQGSVYTKPDQIKKFKSVDKLSVVQQYKKPTTSDDYVGIEIECMVDVNRDELDRLLIKNNLHFNCKLVGDSSIHGDNNTSGKTAIEVTFMAKRSNYKVALKRLTDLIKTVGGYVNESCGLHVHFDMRNSDPRVMYNRLYKTQDILMKMVEKKRRNHTYCRPSMESYDEQVSRSEKYTHINVATLRKHGTIEVRLHQGTCDYDEISNWVDTLHAIIDNKNFVSKTSSVHSIIRQLKLTAKQKRYVLDTIRKQA